MAEPLDPPVARSPGAAGRSNLAGEMNALTGMIRSLEDQLDRMLANNDALKTDLDGERKRRMELERTVEELRGRLIQRSY